jgi:hypothetical protein
MTWRALPISLSFKVSVKNSRVTVLLHKYDNNPWRFLKG